MVVVLACIWLIFNFLTGGKFLTARNLFNLSLQVAVVGIMACGMVLVIVSRNIDLSVGSQLGFIGVFGALFQTAILPVDGAATWWLTCLVMLATGCLIGITQGALIAYAGIPSFVVTLGGLLFFRNAAWLINQGRTISPLNETYQRLGGGLNGTLGSFWSWVFAALAIGCIVLIVYRARQRRSKLSVRQRSGLIDASFVIIWSAVVIGFALVMNAHTFPRTDVPMGIAIPVLILIVVAAATSVLARAHTFGRHVFAMGGNPDSAELAGIDTRRLTVIVFAAMGLSVRPRGDCRHCQA